MKIIHHLPDKSTVTIRLSESDDRINWKPIPCDGSVAITAPGTIAVVDEYAMEARASRAKGGRKSAKAVKPEEVLRDYERMIVRGFPKKTARLRVCKNNGISESTFFSYKRKVRTA